MTDDGTSNGATAVAGRPRRGRASYLEQLSARILRTAERAMKDSPESFVKVTSLIGELLLELRRAEEACRRLEDRLDALALRHRDLLDRVPVPCFITDDRGVVAHANREAVLLLRSSERHLLGKPVGLWFKDRDAAEGFVHELRANGQPLHRQFIVTPRDRRPSLMTVVVQPVDGAAPPMWRWFLLRENGVA